MITPENLHQMRELIGSRLRLIRESKQLTVEQIADMIQVSKSTVSRVETGDLNITLNQLLTLLNALDCYFFFAVKDSEQSTIKQMKSAFEKYQQAP